MKLIYPWILFFFFLTGRNDGPYIFYNDHQAIVYTIVNGKLEKNSQIFKNITVPGYGFSVPIRKKLVVEPCDWKEPSKILVFSDIEGEFQAFRALLLANKVIDAHYKWIFGKGHLVICGDLFDRGKEVAAELWLLYKLEDEAKQAGGYVHTILGNHDIMNMQGDFRYVDSGYYETAKMLELDYKDLYAANTELGRWLRTKNVMERIGNKLYLHGGISPQLLGLQLPIKTLNDSCRPYFETPLKELQGNSRIFMGKPGPFWYRGYFMEPFISDAGIDSSLQFYGVKQIVVGHTIMDSNIAFYHHGRILAVDVDEHDGQHFGALYKDNSWRLVDTSGRTEAIREKQLGAVK